MFLWSMPAPDRTSQRSPSSIWFDMECIALPFCRGECHGGSPNGPIATRLEPSGQERCEEDQMPAIGGRGDGARGVSRGRAGSNRQAGRSRAWASRLSQVRDSRPRAEAPHLRSKTLEERPSKCRNAPDTRGTSFRSHLGNRCGRRTPRAQPVHSSRCGPGAQAPRPGEGSPNRRRIVGRPGPPRASEGERVLGEPDPIRG
jgi:hypothetical protein